MDLFPLAEAVRDAVALMERGDDPEVGALLNAALSAYHDENPSPEALRSAMCDLLPIMERIANWGEPTGFHRVANAVEKLHKEAARWIKGTPTLAEVIPIGKRKQQDE